MSDWIFTLDLETTGTSVQRAKIVQMCGERHNLATGEVEARAHLFNPECPIPAEATNVHGITDAMVKDAAPFRRRAKALVEWIGDADLVGHNIRRFDLPILQRELVDAGLPPLDIEGRTVVDTMILYHLDQPRTLADAIEHYIGPEARKEFEKDAHDALADVKATRDLLHALRAKVPDYHVDLVELDAICELWTPIRQSEFERWFGTVEGEPRIQFGKHQGALLWELPGGYVDWILKQPGPMADPDFEGQVQVALMTRGTHATNRPDPSSGSAQPELF